jgi:hypothetical protein
MMKRIFVLILALTTALSAMTATTYADLSDDIDIDYRVSETTIQENEYFTIYLKFSKLNGSVNDVEYSIKSNSSFKVVSGSSGVSLPDTADFDDEYAFNLQYLGGSSKLPLQVEYKSGAASKVETYNVDITQIIEKDTSSSGSSENEPRIVIESTSIPVATAGETMKLPLTITNDSKYTAKDIAVKLSLSNSDDNPFELNSLNLTEYLGTLNARKSDAVIFNLKVKPYAEEKTYELNVDIKYSNSRNNQFTSSEKIYVKVTSSKNSPMLLIEDIRFSASPVKAGDTFQVSFSISNAGDLDAKDVRLSVEGLSNDGFTLSSGVDSWYFDRINGKEKKNVLLRLAADAGMKSGNYGLSIKMDYKDQGNSSITNSSSFYVKVSGGSKVSNVELQNITVMPQQVKANENFLLSFDAFNGGKSAARNVKLTVKGDEGIISKSPDVRIVEALAPGEHKKLEYLLYASADTKSQNYNIQISMEYEDSETEAKHTVMQYAGVYVEGGNSKITPKIIISNYNFEPKVVRAGEEFSIDLTFMNTSSSKEVKNIKIYLTGIDSNKEGDIVFTPVGSSNTFFIDSISPKSSVSRSIVMYTIPDAQPKYYNITANIEYQDEDGTEYKAEELVGIPVIQQSKLDASEIALAPEIYLGQPAPISLQYYNKGKTKLSNLIIKVEGDFQVENGQSYIGNFESGSSDYFEAMLTATNPGPGTGKVIFSYEDPSGEEFSYEREFSINVVELPPMPMPGDIPQAPPSLKDKILNSTVKNKFFWIGAVVVAAAAVTSLKLVKNKRRKGIELDE